MPPVYLPQATSIGDLYAYCRTAPVGGNITAVVKVAGSAIGTVIINNGQTFPANSVDGKDLPAILPGQPIMLDITCVGPTYPGERLVATIRMSCLLLSVLEAKLLHDPICWRFPICNPRADGKKIQRQANKPENLYGTV